MRAAAPELQSSCADGCAARWGTHARTRALCWQVKFISDKESDKILGAWIMGPNAGELIPECVLAMEYGGTTEDIARTCHGHPTLSEAIKEAAMATVDKPIHS